jgi:hypothetical protein
MVTKRANRSRALDLLLELGIAVGIVSLILVASFFYAGHENDSWMPSPNILKQSAWIIGVTCFGLVYSYLAYSTRRLQRGMADKKHLRPLMTVLENWHMNTFIAAACFIAALALLWQMLSEHGRIDASATLQVLLGSVIVVGGLSMLKMGARLRSHCVARRFLANSLTGYVLPIGLILYGAVRLISGIYRFFK